MRPALTIPLVMILGLTGCLKRDDGPQAKLISADAKDLTSTVVTANLREPIVEGTNLLWCATFPLAWNEMLDVIGMDVQFTDMAEQPAAVLALNDRLVTEDDLDDASYVAMAGLLQDGIVEQIQQSMGVKFPDVTPNLPVPAGADPQSIVAYSYLFKNLLFPKPFERLDDPLNFDGQEILCFGLSGKSDADNDLLRQVSILDYVSDDDFVIELKTRSEADQLILAKVQPQATLEATIENVLTREPEWSILSFNDSDVLKVPMMNFDVRRSFEELTAHPFPAVGLEADEYYIETATQSIRFELNEAGVRLESEAFIFFPLPSAPPEPRYLVFDKPFLLLMKLREADQPYFAMWVDNPELLGKAAQ
ncbi:MAG: hypothetical protein QUV05_15010 [Phycisphaerae bacterium]|nr:hypothetical protein [Phycisphaerae bacterium]